MNAQYREQQFQAYELYLAGLRDECATDLGFLAVNTLLLGTVSPHSDKDTQLTFSPESDRMSQFSTDIASIAILKTMQKPQPNEINLLGYAEYDLAA